MTVLIEALGPSDSGTVYPVHSMRSVPNTLLVDVYFYPMRQTEDSMLTKGDAKEEYQSEISLFISHSCFRFKS